MTAPVPGPLSNPRKIITAGMLALIAEHDENGAGIEEESDEGDEALLSTFGGPERGHECMTDSDSHRQPGRRF